MRCLLFAIVTVGCAPTPPRTVSPATTSFPARAGSAPEELSTERPPITEAPATEAPKPTRDVEEPEAEPEPEPVPQVTCPGAAMRFDAGREVAWVCPDEIATDGLTIIDLANEWTPMLFAATHGGVEPSFRARYLALAAGHDGSGNALDGIDGLAELFGVVPSLQIVRERLGDRARHDCSAKVEATAIALIDQAYGEEHQNDLVLANQTRTLLEAELERERASRNLADLAALATVPELASAYDQWRQLDGVHRGIVAVQQRLVCERFLSKDDVDGLMTSRTANAINLFQRRNFLMPNHHLDAETREAFQRSTRELDFRLALRILRERVVDASGLIEDGTAGAGPQPIVGRMLDPAAMRAARGNEQPLPDGADDLVSAATDAAARQLGWTTPAGVRNFLARYRSGVRVAIALPPPPAYHSAHMDLFAELDRGDVWYDETPTERHIAHRPTVTLYVRDQGTKRPLIRWPTTIGSWSDVQKADGTVEQRWKESSVGPRVWRKLYAAPTWIPPKTTPDRDLVRDLGNGQWELKSEILGPGPRGAFGMMLLLHEARTANGGMRDTGIGTHGSASVVSIVDGTSHGCHRLYNQLAVRLGNFILRHRKHVVRGDQALHYRRAISFRGEFLAQADTRGFLYELTPPVPITVLKGNILSSRKVPPRASAPADPD